MAIKETHSNYQPRDYNAEYDPFTRLDGIPTHVIDTKRLELDPDDTVPEWHNRPDLTDIESLIFRYQAHQTSNSNARDRLRYGHGQTATQTVMLWGFETFQEFRDHLAPRDKAWAKYVWDETACELRQESVKYLFWVPKGEQHTTEPGCWAISMDRQDQRSIWVWSDGDLKVYDRLKLSKQNRIRIKKEQK